MGAFRSCTIPHNDTQCKCEFDSSCFVMLISHSGGSIRTHEHIFLRKQIRNGVTLAHSTIDSFCDFTIYLITFILRIFWFQYKLSSINRILWHNVNCHRKTGLRPRLGGQLRKLHLGTVNSKKGGFKIELNTAIV